MHINAVFQKPERIDSNILKAQSKKCECFKQVWISAERIF